MNLFEEIIDILEKHKCSCFHLCTETNVIKYTGDDINYCESINYTVAELTGFLLTNNIDYTMTKERNILLNHN